MTSTQSRSMLAVVVLAALLGTQSHAEVIELEGTIKAIDVDARTITIERKTAKGTKTLELEVTKKAGDLSSVKVGNTISFGYDPDLELVTKIGGIDGGHGIGAGSDSGGKRVPGPREAELCRQVLQRIERDHYLQPRIDAEVCSRTLAAFIDRLDPLKSFLRQEDIDEYDKNKRTISGQLRTGDISAFAAIYDRFAARVAAQIPVIEELLDSPLEFATPEFIDLGPNAITWPRSDADAREKWRRRLKYDVLVLGMRGVDEDAAKEQLRRRYTAFSANIDKASMGAVLGDVLDSLVKVVDPFSSYLPLANNPATNTDTNSLSAGVGVTLAREEAYFVIATLTPGEAAEKDGRLAPGDRLIGIGQGVGGQIEDIANRSVSEVSRLLAGEPGTTVSLEVITNEGDLVRVYNIHRHRIDVARAQVLSEVFEVARPKGKVKKVGVIRIPGFYRLEAGEMGVKQGKSVVVECRQLCERFTRDELDCIVLDVRDNGGGGMPAVVGTVGLFIEAGHVASWRTKEGDVTPFSDDDADVAWDGPLVVWTNGYTAGGAEIFAAAIQDHNRGLIVGNYATYGKASGHTRTLVGEGDLGGTLQLTTQVAYRARGEGIQHRGVLSDVLLPSEQDLLHKEGSALSGPAVDRIANSVFQPAREERPEVLGRIQGKSEERVGRAPDFVSVSQANRKRMERQQSGKVSLMKEKFVAANQLPPTEESGNRNSVGIRRDFYLDEVLAIAADLAVELE